MLHRVKDVGQRVNEYYEASDFIVGETLSVLGRTFLIYDADEFTKVNNNITR